MAFTEVDVKQIRGIVREEIETAFRALFVAARLEDFAGLMAPEIEVRMKEALASIEGNAEKL